MINIIGLGYIGLPTALMFAKHGITVVGSDYNEKLISNLREERLPFEEKDLDEVFKSALSNATITFSTEYQKADVYIVAVPTPYLEENKKINPEYVVSAVRSILKICNNGSIISIESTIPPGTIDKYIRPLVAENGFKIGENIHLAHTPERIIPGNMIRELEENSRTIGCDKQEIGEVLKRLYSIFCKGEIVLTDICTAEMTKVVENTYRDVNIAFANELAQISRQENLDVYEIIRIANMHPRVNILSPGPGVGGHCISVDPWFLIGQNPDLTKVITASREVNNHMPWFVFQRIKAIMKKHDIEDFSRVGLYGLTYKENVDDTRESPTLQLLSLLKKENITDMKVYDPFVKNQLTENQCYQLSDFLLHVDFIVILVPHEEVLIHIELFRKKIILDTKNVMKDVKQRENIEVL